MFDGKLSQLPTASGLVGKSVASLAPTFRVSPVTSNLSSAPGIASTRRTLPQRRNAAPLALTKWKDESRCGSTVTLCDSSTRVCGRLREHTFEIHKSLGQGCVQIGDLAVQVGRGHE